MGLHESAEMLIYRSLIPEKKKNAELQVFLLPVTLFIGKREKKRGGSSSFIEECVISDNKRHKRQLTPILSPAEGL